MLNPDAPKRWHFGKTELDERGSVTVGGRAIALDASSFRILLALLRHAGEVVTKDELLESGWPGRVVSENSLAKAISRLRQALGEDANAIGAVYGYGYRLEAQVLVQADGHARVPAGPPHPQPGEVLALRPEWRIVSRLGQGAAGATVLARNAAGEARVFKFAIGEAGLRGLRREVALSRYLAATLPDTAAVTPLLGWNLSQPPFFVETPFHPEGDLRAFAGRDRLKLLPLPARVELCAQLCEAVAALHGAGVIHRDLKPENLYPVADAAAPYGWRIVLGDLGAGEAALSPQLAELGLTLSLVGGKDGISSQAGSVLYLAPEIVAGETATQLSDVYALGVLLYQIVVADLRRPLAPGWEADVDDELLRQDIALAAAAKPAQRLIDARGLMHRLRSLDARRQELEERRQRRAESERQRLHLAQTEHRRRFALVGFAVATMLLAVVGSMYVYAQRALELARRSAAEKQDVVEFFARRMLAAADPYSAGHGNILMREAVDAAAPLVETNFADQPAVAVSLHQIIGDMYVGMSRYPQAVSHYRKALGRHRALRAKAADPRLEAGLRLSLCGALRAQGDYGDAEAECGRAREVLRRAQLPTERVDVELQALRFEQGQCRDAVPVLLGIGRRFDALAPQAAAASTEWGGPAHYYAALCLQELGRMREAGRRFVRTIDLLRGSDGAESPKLGWTLADYGVLLIEQGRLDEAQAVLEESHGIFTRNLDPENPDRVQAEYGLALLHMARRQWQDAIPILERVLHSERAVLGETHRWVQETSSSLALAQAQAGLRQEAREGLAQVMQQAGPRLPGFGTRATWLLERWIDTALALGEAELAQRLIGQQAQAMALLEPGHPRLAAFQRQRERLVPEGAVRLSD